MQERRYDIDWLRILVMPAVFFFHCARFFGGGTWHLNNNEQSIVALVFIGWLDMWFMPLFFLLSGVGSWYALRSGNNGQYLLGRVKRLLVPLYTVGLFLLLPPSCTLSSLAIKDMPVTSVRCSRIISARWAISLLTGPEVSYMCPFPAIFGFCSFFS